MPSFNKHFTSGRVGSKPELRFTPSGREVTSFRMVKQDRRLNQQTQQWEDGEATWYDVTVWGRQASNAAASLENGWDITVIGEVKAGSYVTREGETRLKNEIKADEILVSLDHHVLAMVEKSAYGNKVSGGTGTPANSSSYNRPAPSAGGGGGWNAAGGGEEEPPF